MNQKDLMPLAKLETKIINLISDAESGQLTDSDLQGVVQAIVLQAYQLGQKSK